MKFTQTIHFYGVNDDSTITFYVLDENDNKQFFRARARYKLLAELDALKQTAEAEKVKEALTMEATFGLAYVRNTGLVLQLIEVKY